MPREKRVQRACDQCNFRRVKCSHDQPCNNCRRYDVDCTYWKAARGIESSGSRIASLKRLRQGQSRNTSESPGPVLDSNSPSPVPFNPSSNSDRTHYNRSPTLAVENIGDNATTSSYLPRDEQRSAPKTDPNKRQRNVQRIAQNARLEPATIPMLDMTSNLANLIESAFSELAPDVATHFRLPNLETPVAEPVFNATTFSERSQFPDFGAFMDLSLSSLPLGTAPPNTSFMQSSNPTFVSSDSHSGNNHASLQDIDNSDDESLSFDVETSSLSDSVLIPRIAIFFERLHPIIPVFTRAWLFTRLDKSHQYSDRQFAAMLLSMSSLSLIQPVHSSEGTNSKLNTKCAVSLLKECIRVRSVPAFGRKPTLDMVLTSFYMFACFFGLHEDDSAWFRLREAITLGQILKLHEPSAYESLEHDERERRLRTYWILAITERAVALQRGHSIGIHGHPSESMKSISQKFNIGELDDFPRNQLQLFDSVDEDFVNCWNGHCAGEKCRKLHTDKALSLNSSFANGQIIESKKPSFEHEGSITFKRSAETYGNVDSRTPSRSKRRHTELQRADVEVTRHWLLNRLWYVCLTHGLIVGDTPHSPLRPDYPIAIARSMLVICEELTLVSMEANGLGFCEKLYDIVRTLVIVCHMFSEESSDILRTTTDFGDSVRDLDNNIRRNQTDISINAQMHVSHLLTDQIDATNSNSRQTHIKPTLQHMISDHYIPPSATTEPSHDNYSRPPSSLSHSLPSKYTTVQDIFNGYLSVFRRFRAGDHHFLAKLIETMRDLSLDIDE